MSENEQLKAVIEELRVSILCILLFLFLLMWSYQFSLVLDRTIDIKLCRAEAEKQAMGSVEFSLKPMPFLLYMYELFL